MTHPHFYAQQLHSKGSSQDRFLPYLLLGVSEEAANGGLSHCKQILMMEFSDYLNSKWTWGSKLLLSRFREQSGWHSNFNE
jgi:hypothetical protein